MKVELHPPSLACPRDSLMVVLPVTGMGRSSALHDLNPTYYFSPTLVRFQNTEFINSVDSCS